MEKTITISLSNIAAIMAISKERDNFQEYNKVCSACAAIVGKEIFIEAAEMADRIIAQRSSKANSREAK